MIKYILPIFACLFLVVGCVTTGDLQELADIHGESLHGIKVAQEEYQAKLEGILADQTKSEAERYDDMREAAEARNKAIEEIAKAAGTSVDQLIAVIEARTKDAIEGVGTVTGNPLLDLFVNTLLAAGLGAAGADKIRDRRRLLRQEPVGVTLSATPTV